MASSPAIARRRTVIVNASLKLDDVLVSIGVPVYNGAARIGRVLDSLLGQTHHHIEVIVSDNASTDATPDVCREYAARDSRVVYSRTATNIGAGDNFDRVLRLARGEFFMWAADDDWWAPTFVEENLRNLLEHPDLVASISRVRYTDGDRSVSWHLLNRADTRPLLGSVSANVRDYVANHGRNSRFYSLFRRDVLLRYMPFEPYWASDNGVVVHTLAHGKYGEVPKVLYHRDVGGESSNEYWLLTREKKSRIARFLPFWDYSVAIWRMPHVKHDVGLIIALLITNGIFFLWLVLARAKELLRRK